MIRIDRRSVQNFDWVLVGILGVLVIMSLINLYSATAGGVEGGSSDILDRQMMALTGGGVVMLVVAFIDYRHYERLAPLAFVGVLALLALTLVVGSETRGAQAWLFQGRFQPSELAKIGLVLALARYFSRTPPTMTSRGIPSRYASPKPLIACVTPAAGTMTSVPIWPSDVRLTASPIIAAPPSWVTNTGRIRFDWASSSYSSVTCTPGMPNVCDIGSCSKA